MKKWYRASGAPVTVDGLRRGKHNIFEAESTDPYVKRLVDNGNLLEFKKVVPDKPDLTTPKVNSSKELDSSEE